MLVFIITEEEGLLEKGQGSEQKAQSLVWV